MKIFVGTLFSGENEYHECLESIEKQTFKNYDLYVYEHLPKFEAHKTLYNAFIEQKDKYDLLIKIDADMVLESSRLFERVVEKFRKCPHMDILGIAISDFFSGGYIHGLNCYRNSVTWALEPENVNADKTNIGRGYQIIYDDNDLAPAAIHCKNPSKLQAYHFGIHRGIKVLAPKHSTTHWELLKKTWKNFLKTGDVRIGMASLGAELVYAGKYTKEDIDYTNPILKADLEKYQDLNRHAIKKEILKMRLLNWGLLPSDIRRRIIRWKLRTR